MEVRDPKGQESKKPKGQGRVGVLRRGQQLQTDFCTILARRWSQVATTDFVLLTVILYQT